MSNLQPNNSVSVKLIGGEEAEIIADYMLDNIPELSVEDHESYLSLTVDNQTLRFDMESLSAEMGYPYSTSKFLAVLTTYKGDIEVGDDFVAVHVFSPNN
ncbi:MAG: hypothetical protein CL693_20295 [Cellvibrionaceae bacterium]|nr:hypothetical protein [Cellvibrionaceae bacterium]|tara:strand:+ start:32477 stop:32776 length:300 start_codon:yes stop_codon:yes gene_type:complete